MRSLILKPTIRADCSPDKAASFDPVNYRNHFVTILGTIQGEQPCFINKVPYNFPEVNMQGIQCGI